MRLLVDPNAVLEEIGIREDDAILVEVRFFIIIVHLPTLRWHCQEIIFVK